MGEEHDVSDMVFASPFVSASARDRSETATPSFLARGDLVTVVVGEQPFQLLRSTLVDRDANTSLLRVLFRHDRDEDDSVGAVDTSLEYEPTWKSFIKRSEDGKYHIDRDPSYFSAIVEYLRSGEVVVENANELSGLLVEALFFRLHGLVEKIQNKMLSEDDDNVGEDSIDISQILLQSPSISDSGSESRVMELEDQLEMSGSTIKALRKENIRLRREIATSKAKPMLDTTTAITERDKRIAALEAKVGEKDRLCDQYRQRISTLLEVAKETQEQLRVREAELAKAVQSTPESLPWTVRRFAALSTVTPADDREELVTVHVQPYADTIGNAYRATLSMRGEDTVLQAKELIAADTGWKTTWIRLCGPEGILASSSTLANAQISDGSVLQWMLRVGSDVEDDQEEEERGREGENGVTEPHGTSAGETATFARSASSRSIGEGAENTFTVSVTVSSGDSSVTHDFRVRQSDTLLSLKEKIAAAAGVTSALRLYIPDGTKRKLLLGRTLGDCGIHGNTRIAIRVRPRSTASR